MIMSSSLGIMEEDYWHLANMQAELVLLTSCTDLDSVNSCYYSDELHVFRKQEAFFSG